MTTWDYVLGWAVGMMVFIVWRRRNNRWDILAAVLWPMMLVLIVGMAIGDSFKSGRSQ